MIVKIDGKIIDFFTDVEIELKLDSIASTFTFASRFLFDAKFESCNNGVLPISSFRFLAIFAINLFVCVRRSGNCPGLVYIFSLVDFFSIRKNDTIIYIAKIELDHSFHNRTDVVFLYPVYGMPLSVFLQICCKT